MAKLLTEAVPSKYFINYGMDTQNEHNPFRPEKIVAIPNTERLICTEVHYRWVPRADPKFGGGGYWNDYGYVSPFDSRNIPNELKPETDLVKTMISCNGSGNFAEVVCNCKISEIKFYETYEEAYKTFVDAINNYLAKGGTSK